MTYKEIIEYHQIGLADYNKFWESSKSREAAGVTLEEAAYGILENSGMLYRYTADSSYIERINADVEALIESALEYVNGMTITDSIETIVNAVEFSDFDLNDAELLMEARDGLEMVKLTMVEVIKPLVYAGNLMLMDKLDAIDLLALKFDKAIAKDKALATIATRYLAFLKEHIKIELSEEDFWWFFKARILDEELGKQEKELSSLIADAAERNSYEEGNNSKSPVLIAFCPVDNVYEETAMAAGSLDIVPAGEFQGKYKNIPVTISCQRSRTGRVSVVVTGTDGNEIPDMEGASCVFLKNDKKIASCRISGGTGSCLTESTFDSVAIYLSASSK